MHATTTAAAAETQLQQNAPTTAATATTTPATTRQAEFRVPQRIVVASISLALASTAQSAAAASTAESTAAAASTATAAASASTSIWLLGKNNLREIYVMLCTSAAMSYVRIRIRWPQARHIYISQSIHL